MKNKKDDMAKVVYKNASFAPKINDYKLENYTSPEKLVKVEIENKQIEIKHSNEKKKNNIDSLKNKNSQKQILINKNINNFCDVNNNHVESDEEDD